MQVLPTTNIIMYYASQCMHELACIQVLFTTKYAILDLILLNADTHVSTGTVYNMYGGESTGIGLLG